MWIIEWLPDAVIYGATFLSALALIVSTFFKNLPFVGQYARAIQFGSAVALLLGIYLCGGISNEAKWQARVKEMEVKVAAAEAKSAQQNVKIVEKVVKQIEIVKETTNENLRVAQEVVAKDLDASCRLTDASVMLHNSASQNEVSRGTSDPAGRTSEVKASELVTTVVENYGTYYQVVEKLKGWQEWYKSQKSIFEEAMK